MGAEGLQLPGIQLICLMSGNNVWGWQAKEIYTVRGLHLKMLQVWGLCMQNHDVTKPDAQQTFRLMHYFSVEGKEFPEDFPRVLHFLLACGRMLHLMLSCCICDGQRRHVCRLSTCDAHTSFGSASLSLVSSL